ncbi:hypothetical protein E8P77_31675 [Soehngenia saccharolytica]|nr:hypothetical protein E8P77_31675 [Soehngenia saccharolytica]
MSKKAISGLNSGIMSHGGGGNVQSSGKTDYGQSKWKVSSTNVDDDAPKSGTNENTGENSGIMSRGGRGHVQAAGDTKYGSSEWTVESEGTGGKGKNTKGKK